MNTDFLKNFSNKTKETLEPVTKFNELLSQSVQDAFKAQMDSTKNILNLRVLNLKLYPK
mgnify:CR=1 FL=1